MRRAIDAYFADHTKYPESLEALVEAKYLRGIPTDPFTNAQDSWELVVPTPTAEGEAAEGGFEDVHSGSDLVGLNGTPYREW
jgi:general secretion pathway protein G